MRTPLLTAIVGALLIGTLVAQPPQPEPPAPPTEQGVGERIGESVDRGLNTLGKRIRRGWAEIRQSVDELGVQGRVYGRLHWDKSLANVTIDISVQNENVVTLSGSVPDEASHGTAVRLAQDTVGVHQVVDHLTVASTKIETVPPIGSAPSSSTPVGTTPAGK